MKRTNFERVLVAGGAGFLGSHIVEHLLKSKAEVVCVDDLSTGRIENINRHFDNNRFSFVRQSVVEPLDFKTRFCAIFNFAQAASPRAYKKQPIETMKAAVIGTLNLLELATRNESVFVFASTSEVYGDPLCHPQSESYLGNVNPIGPRACYDEGKRAAEALCFDFDRVHGTNVKVARIFNTYGPGMRPDDGRAVPTFLSAALAGRPLEIFGNGQQTRSFCYVDDLVDGLLRLSVSGKQINGPVNLGNPSEIKIVDLAHTILSITGSSSPVVFSVGDVDDPKKRCPDIRMAEQKLGWSPAVNLKQGLTVMAQDWLANKNKYLSGSF